MAEPADPALVVASPVASAAATAPREDDAVPVASGDATNYGPESEIHMAEPNRKYREYDNGKTIRPLENLLFPGDYPFPRKKEGFWKCPVKYCPAEAMRKTSGLGTHWQAAHKETAFRDNGDGTLTAIGTCTRSMVVEQANPVPQTGTTGNRKRNRQSSSPNKRARMEGDSDQAEQELNRQNGHDNEVITVSDSELEEDEERAPDLTEQSSTRDAGGSKNSSGSSGLDQIPKFLLRKRQELLAEEDESIPLSADTIDAYTEFLKKRHKLQDRVFAFPATFWRSQSDKQPTELPTDKPLLANVHDSLIFPIYQAEGTGKGWYGVFVGRQAHAKFLFAIINTTSDGTTDNEDPHQNEAANIFLFLQRQGLLGRNATVTFAQTNPNLNSSRAPDTADPVTDSGVLFLRVLVCFFAHPNTFFHDVAQGHDLYSTVHGKPGTTDYDIPTRKSALAELRTELHQQFVSWADERFAVLVDEYTGGNVTEKRHVLLLHAISANEMMDLVGDSQDNQDGHDDRGAEAASPETVQEIRSDLQESAAPAPATTPAPARAPVPAKAAATSIAPAVPSTPAQAPTQAPVQVRAQARAEAPSQSPTQLHTRPPAQLPAQAPSQPPSQPQAQTTTPTRPRPAVSRVDGHDTRPATRPQPTRTRAQTPAQPSTSTSTSTLSNHLRERPSNAVTPQPLVAEQPPNTRQRATTGRSLPAVQQQPSSKPSRQQRDGRSFRAATAEMEADGNESNNFPTGDGAANIDAASGSHTNNRFVARK